MPINLSQLDIRPLASVASASTPNLGLEPYGIDYKTLINSRDERAIAELGAQVQLKSQATQERIQQLQNEGLLTRTQADNAAQKEIESAKLAQKTLDDQMKNFISSEQNSILGQHYQAQNQLGQQQLGLDTFKAQNDVQLKGQELAQTGAFQQGQLANQSRQVDIQQQQADQEQQLNQIKIIAAQKEEQRNAMGAYGSTVLMINNAIKDPKEREKYINNVINDAVQNQGLTPEQAEGFLKLSPNEQMFKAAQWTSMVGAASTASSKAKESGMSFTMGADGQVQLVPAEKGESSLDKELAKADKTTVEDAINLRSKVTRYLEMNDLAMKQLDKVPDLALGPVAEKLGAGNLSKEAQTLKSYLSGAQLLSKDIIGLKGGAQGMTEGEWKMVQSLAGGTFQSKESLKEVLTTMQKVAEKVRAREWNTESEIRKRGKDYESWLKSNPAPDVRVINKDGQAGYISASELSDALKEGYKQI